MVRYFVGTIIGAGITMILKFYSNSALKSFVIFKYFSETTINTQTLILIASYGFAYCYIASGPMLVVHTSRCIFRKRKLRDVLVLFIPILIISSAIATIANIKYRNCFWSANLYFLVILAQLLILYLLFVHFRDEFRLFYRNIAVARGTKKNIGIKKEYIESYRHLREHGNAFIILVYEFILGYTLLNIPSIPGYDTEILVGLIICLWVLPAALIWIAGTIMEYKLEDNSFFEV